MNNPSLGTEVENGGFWKFFIDLAVIVAAAMLYFKTSEVMTALAPNAILGQTGLAVLYGTATALLIEGVTLSLHFLRAFAGNNRAEYYKWFLFGVSTMCQFLDTTLVKNAMNGVQATPVQAFFNWAALGILPAVFFGLLWVKGGDRTSIKSRGQWIGLIPSIKVLLFGSSNTTTVAQTSPDVQTNDEQQREVRRTRSTRTNGQHSVPEEETNPT